jgi:hypothetical protein
MGRLDFFTKSPDCRGRVIYFNWSVLNIGQGVKGNPWFDFDEGMIYIGFKII